MVKHEIQHPALYRAAYDALRTCPVRVEWREEAGRWYHAVPRMYVKDALTCVRQQRADAADQDYRWSGKRPAAEGNGSVPGVPSKYFSRGLGDSALGELTADRCRISLDHDINRLLDPRRKDLPTPHDPRTPAEPPNITESGFHAVLVAKEIFVLTAKPGWKFADLSNASNKGSGTLDEIMDHLWRTPEVREQLERAGYGHPDLEALSAPTDHSLAAAIGHAVWDTRPHDRSIAGLKVTSMQSDAGLKLGYDSADNLVCIGAAGTWINALRSEHGLVWQSDSNGSLKEKFRSCLPTLASKLYDSEDELRAAEGPARSSVDLGSARAAPS